MKEISLKIHFSKFSFFFVTVFDPINAPLVNLRDFFQNNIFNYSKLLNGSVYIKCKSPIYFLFGQDWPFVWLYIT